MPWPFARRTVTSSTEDFAPRCPVALVLDTSEAFRAAPPAALHAQLGQLWRSLNDDPIAAERIEIAVLTAGGGARLLDPRDGRRSLRDEDAARGFALAASTRPPQPGAGGACFAARAVRLAIGLLKDRRDQHQQGGNDVFTPWLVLVAAAPPEPEWSGTRDMVALEESAGRLIFRVVATPGTDAESTREYWPTQPPRLLADLASELRAAARGMSPNSSVAPV